MESNINSEKEKTTQSTSSVNGEADSNKNLWKYRGVEDVYFQRESMINFWTVMGGIAAGALLTQIAPLEKEILASRWYLLFYFLGSFLTIVNSWIQSTWGTLVLRWPITVPGTLIFLAGLFSLSIQSLLVTRPASWMAASVAVVFLSILMQYFFSKTGAWIAFSPERIMGFRKVNRVYYIFLLVTFLGSAQLFFFPSQLAELIWGVIALASSILALIIQHKGMLQERIDLEIP